MTAQFEQFVAVPHFEGKREHLSRTSDGLLARINEEANGKAKLWIITEPCRANDWAHEVIHVQGKPFNTADHAKVFARDWIRGRPQ